MEFYDHKKVDVMFSKEEIDARIKVLGQRITEDYLASDRPVVLIGVLKGSFLSG